MSIPNELGWLRYEKLRKLSPRQFADLHARNIAGEAAFDDLVDALPMPSTRRPDATHPAAAATAAPSASMQVSVIPPDPMLFVGIEAMSAAQAKGAYRSGLPEAWPAMLAWQAANPIQ